MHKIQEKQFTLEDFSCEYLVSESMELLEDTIDKLNKFRDDYNNYDKKNVFYIDNDQQIVDKKVIWEQMIQLLPSSYNQTRNVMLNYEVLANIYKSRKNHKLDEWREFCKWIETLPYSELICKNELVMTPNECREKLGLEPINEVGTVEYGKDHPEWVAKVKEMADELICYGD